MANQTISDSQRRLNQELHQARPDFGSRGGAGNDGVMQAIGRYKELNAIESVLDYGTGKGTFPKNLKKAFSDLEVGAYEIEIAGNSSSVEYTTPVNLNIYDNNLEAPNLLNPENQETDVSETPVLSWQALENANS